MALGFIMPLRRGCAESRPSQSTLAERTCMLDYPEGTGMTRRQRVPTMQRYTTGHTQVQLKTPRHPRLARAWVQDMTSHLSLLSQQFIASRLWTDSVACGQLFRTTIVDFGWTV